MTEQKITPFLFEGEQMVRTVERNGAPWFLVSDVCKALNLSNTTKAIGGLDEDEKSTFTLSAGGPDRLIISESGLYMLILRSDGAIKPGTVAHRFRKWVTAEVLPALRQTGSYSIHPPVHPAIDEDDIQTPDGMKLRKVNTAARCFGERAGAQLWVKLGLDWVPAMASALSQADLLDMQNPPPGSVTVTVTPMAQVSR